LHETRLADDANNVGEIMIKPENVQKLTEVFGSANQVTFGQLVPPFLLICSVYPPVGAALVDTSQFMSKLLERLQHKKQDALVRVNLLKLLASLYEAYPKQRQMLATYNLQAIVSQLTGERSVLIQELASKLLTSFKSAK